MPSGRKLRRTLLDIGHKEECVVCKTGLMWNGKKLTLHVDHVDGNRKNNEVSNLRFLCPNCHSQTNTYCGRNLLGKNRFAKANAFRDFIMGMEPEKRSEYLASKSYDEMCSEHGIPNQVIWRLLKSLGIKKTPVYRARGNTPRKCDRPSKEELLRMVSSMPMTKVGKAFGVSDNAVRKWCKWEGISPQNFYLRKNQKMIGKSTDSI